MPRKISNYAVLLSFILGFATLLLWKHGRAEYAIAYQSENAYWYVVCSDGRFVCGVIPTTGMPRGLSLTSSADGDRISSAIVTKIVYPNGHVSHWKSYDVPCSAVAAATAILPVLWIFALVSKLRRRSRRGFCVVCAYNLTGNKSGVCPECGTAVSSERVPGMPGLAGTVAECGKGAAAEC